MDDEYSNYAMMMGYLYDAIDALKKAMLYMDLRDEDLYFEKIEEFIEFLEGEFE